MGSSLTLSNSLQRRLGVHSLTQFWLGLAGIASDSTGQGLSDCPASPSPHFRCQWQARISNCASDPAAVGQRLNNLLERLTESRETLLPAWEDVIEVTDEHPDEQIHRVRPGNPGEQELPSWWSWCVTLLEWTCSPTWSNATPWV